MPEPPSRKRFQIHLSTAVVMMIAAGGLMWVNVRERSCVTGYYFDSSAFSIPYTHYSRGWPGIIVGHRDELTYESDDGKIRTIHALKEFKIQGLLLNLMIACLILYFVWFVCEWWIRWRAARKGA